MPAGLTPFLSLILAAWLGAQNLDLSQLKQDTRILEGIIEDVLKQHFDAFSIDAHPQASYLQGYGLAVSFRLKINRATIRTPFGEVRPPRGTTSRSVQAQIQLVRDSMIEVLANYGNSVKQLGEEEWISIAAHVEDRNEIEPTKSNSVMVFSVRKTDVDLYTMKRISREGFQSRIATLEY